MMYELREVELMDSVDQLYIQNCILEHILTTEKKRKETFISWGLIKKAAVYEAEWSLVPGIEQALNICGRKEKQMERKAAIGRMRQV